MCQNVEKIRKIARNFEICKIVKSTRPLKIDFAFVPFSVASVDGKNLCFTPLMYYIILGDLFLVPLLYVLYIVLPR